MIFENLTNKFFNNKQTNLLNDKNKIILENILRIGLLKPFNIFLNFAAFTLSLKLINKPEYGLFLTITSFINWFSLIDVAIGNGLRNNLTTAITKKDLKKAQSLVSTSYFIISAILLFFLGAFFIVSSFIDWKNVFSTQEDVNNIVAIVAISFALRMIMQLIQTVYVSYQLAARNETINFITQLLINLSFIILPYVTIASIEKITFIYSFAPILILSAYTFFDFKGTFKDISPKYGSIDFKGFKNVLSLGFDFFFIQIAVIILFSLNNFMINRYFRPEDVTEYNIATKYFSVTSIIFSIILTPLWSMLTKASVENDFTWIKNIYFKCIKVWALSVPVLILLLIASDYMYKMWLGQDIKVSFQFTLVSFFYFLIFTWNTIQATFLNGMGKIRLQLILSFVGILIYFPTAYFLQSFMGASGIPTATCVSLLVGAVIFPVQIIKLTNKNK